ncbi:hypothetical protein LguiB_019958 [Lonicera macranthoides]
MGSSSMKVHQFTRGLIWEHEPSSLTLSLCKRLRPLAPKIPDTTTTTTTVTPFDLKSFIRPDCGPRKLGEVEEESPYKRKCRSWSFESVEEEEDQKKGNYCKEAEGDHDQTLELFPLHPELGR